MTNTYFMRTHLLQSGQKVPETEARGETNLRDCLWEKTTPFEALIGATFMGVNRLDDFHPTPQQELRKQTKFIEISIISHDIIKSMK